MSARQCVRESDIAFDLVVADLALALCVGTNEKSSRAIGASYYVSWENVPQWEECKGNKVRLIGVKVDGGGHMESVAGQTYFDRKKRGEFVDYLWNIIGAVRAGANIEKQMQ